MRYSANRLLYMVFGLMLAMTAWSQNTRVSGVVLDAETGEPIPFSNVIFLGTSIGTISEFDGRFELQTIQEVDSVQASYLGYKVQTLPVKRGISQEVTFRLSPESVNLESVDVVAEQTVERDDPAIVLLRNIWKHKKNNSPERLTAYEAERYEKIEFDLNNIDDEFRQRKIFKPFQIVFDYTDTSETNGKVFLPMFISENVYREYYRRDPKQRKEVLVANKSAGFDQTAGISEFWGALYQEYNFYDNYITLLQKQFISPISQFGLLSYRYYLTDSTEVDGNKIYTVAFIPKRKQELTFKGEFQVQDSSFAIVSFDMTMTGDANVNFVNALRIKQNFELMNDSVWMVSKDYILMDFALTDGKDVKGIYGTKTTYYRNFTFNQPREVEFYKSTEILREEIDQRSTDESYWTSIREEELSEQERGIYEMVDTLKRVPAFNTYLDIIAFVLSGYYETDAGLDIGPVLKTLSFNPIEGLRIRAGGRTYWDRNDPFRIYGHLAYGTRDQRLKYDVGVKGLLPSKKRQELGLFYKFDMEQLGQRYTTTGTQTDNLLASLLRRYPFDKLSLVEELKLYYEPELFKNFKVRISGIHRKIYDAGTLDFTFYSRDFTDTTRSINTSELNIQFRYEPGRKFLNYGVDLIDIYTGNPTFTLSYTAGIQGVLDSDYDYHKLYLSYDHPIDVPALGRSVVLIEAGKVFGNVPYPLLDVVPGNPTFSHSRYIFNMMDFFEFVTDEYASIHYEHHFMGLFFNRVPLLRKLKWREVVTGHAIIGTLNPDNMMLSNQQLIAPERGYYEASVGIENIFKFLRVDAFWRFSYLDNPRAQPFGIRLDLSVKF